MCVLIKNITQDSIWSQSVSWGKISLSKTGKEPVQKKWREWEGCGPLSCLFLPITLTSENFPPGCWNTVFLWFLSVLEKLIIYGTEGKLELIQCIKRKMSKWKPPERRDFLLTPFPSATLSQPFNCECSRIICPLSLSRLIISTSNYTWIRS